MARSMAVWRHAAAVASSADAPISLRKVRRTPPAMGAETKPWMPLARSPEIPALQPRIVSVQELQRLGLELGPRVAELPLFRVKERALIVAVKRHGVEVGRAPDGDDVRALERGLD